MRLARIAAPVRAGAYWRPALFHATAIAMTYGAAPLHGLHNDWRLHVGLWAAWLLVAALEMQALARRRPFTLWAPLLLIRVLDYSLTQSWVDCVLTYSLVFLTRGVVNLLLESLR